MPSVADINTLIEDGANAILAGDWSTALVKASAAELMLSVVPNGSAGGNTTQFREGIKSAISNIRSQSNAAKVAAAGGIHRSNIVYRGESCDDEEACCG